MTLKNLLGISLDAAQPDAALITKLLAAAERNIADAQNASVSAETRFDAAYKAIMQTSMAALNANGYRPLTSKPGHHQAAIQTLPYSIGLPKGEVIVLDALRKRRNLSDYSGDPIGEEAVKECLASAKALLKHFRAWLHSRHPELN